MRKVERNMVAAIRDGRNMHDGNTAVEFRPGQALGVGRVTLHGNTIAIIMRDGSVRLDRRTLGRWPTRTTASRVRALGFTAYIRGGRLYAGPDSADPDPAPPALRDSLTPHT